MEKASLSKVPEITLAFWIIKIMATTLGETGGDSLSMTLNLGYALSTGIFFVIFIAAAAAQIRARRYHPALYWLAIVATTTVGTTMADFADRSLGIGYIGGSTILFLLLLAVLAAWRFTLGSVSASNIVDARQESFYWIAILSSNTLGTALGDYAADPDTGLGFGYEGGALLFAGLLGVLALCYFFTRLSRVFLFWAAFILTRPLGATLGDTLTKPVANGGLHLSRIGSSAVLAALMIAGILLTQRKAAQNGH